MDSNSRKLTCHYSNKSPGLFVKEFHKQVMCSRSVFNYQTNFLAIFIWVTEMYFGTEVYEFCNKKFQHLTGCEQHFRWVDPSQSNPKPLGFRHQPQGKITLQNQLKKTLRK